jgi:hypothetical protein
MTEAFETLEASLLAAGWAPAESGPRWYAKRFDWTPAAEQGDGRSRDVA